MREHVPATRRFAPLEARQSASQSPAAAARRHAQRTQASPQVRSLSRAACSLSRRSSRYSELKDCSRMILLPGTQNGRRKVRVVGRVRVMLRLECKAVSEMVDAGAFSRDAAVEKVSGVELQPRLGGENVERAAG